MRSEAQTAARGGVPARRGPGADSRVVCSERRFLYRLPAIWSGGGNALGGRLPDAVIGAGDRVIALLLPVPFDLRVARRRGWFGTGWDFPHPGRGVVAGTPGSAVPGCRLYRRSSPGGRGVEDQRAVGDRGCRRGWAPVTARPPACCKRPRRSIHRHACHGCRTGGGPASAPVWFDRDDL